MSGGWGVLLQYSPELLQGWKNTIALVVSAAIIGSLAGSVICAGNMSARGPLYYLCMIYTNTFRALPETVLIFWIYFCGPFIFTFNLDAWQSGLLSMCLISTAYFAEMARAGIQSVDRGQWEAAKSLGMKRIWLWLDIVLPQAFRAMLPASMLLVAQIVKMSGLVSAVGVAELVYQAQTLGAATFRYVELFTAVAAAYFIMIFPLSLLSKFLEKRLRTRAH